MSLLKAPPGVAELRQHFQHASLPFYFPPLPDRPSKEEYLDAFAIRDQIANLFLGDKPFFARDRDATGGDLRKRQEVEELCRSILAQGATQRNGLMKRKGGGVDRVASLRKSIDSSESEKWQVSKRPFCKLLLDNYAAPILYGFVREVAYYMAENHYRNPHSHLSPEIWLGFEHWQSLDPLTKARVVRRAKAYAAMEKTAYELESRRRLSALPSASEEQSTTSHSLTHRHLPSLTSRQARRSGLSQDELRSRWEGR